MQSPLTHNNRDCWTILDILEWTTLYFKRHGIENGRVDAEVLLANILESKRIDLYLHYDQPLTADELHRFRGLIKRRANREPIAYIIGEKEFWSLCFKVSKDILIPRPETECIVETALNIIKDSNKPDPLKILELGTGSGAIMVALASEMSNNCFAATDLSFNAIKIARKNERQLIADNIVNWIVGDWLKPVKETGINYDLIISNPPYIRKDMIQKLEPEIFLFEPISALDGGIDGLSCLKKIIPEATFRLCPGGYLLLEIGFDQKESVEKIARSCLSFESISFKKDYSGHDRVAILRLSRSRADR
jgi:release factor glutamine methyltransferase